MPEQSSLRSNIVIPLSLFAAALLTRIPFTSKLLYHMDSVQFALGLRNYDVRVHQPHPPGYFLYVMLGRLFSLFLNDANTVFVVISILFSGLAVVAVYFLGRDIFDQRTGLLAAALALTSPNLWFHGEVALTYITEAFFSTMIALCCWRVYRGDQKYVWISVVALGLAGGIRQNTAVFMLPLWFFSVAKVPLRKTMAAFLLMGIVCSLWFFPMILLTGGWAAYFDAFKELMIYNTGNVSVFEKGWSSLRIFSADLLEFTFYGTGAATVILGLAAYSVLRRRRVKELDHGKTLFFSFWVLPAVCFYLLIFMAPNAGYTLIFLPALLLLAASSLSYLSEDLKSAAGVRLYLPSAAAVVMLNVLFFCLSTYPVSYREIRNHDRNLAELLSTVKTFSRARTAIFVRPYIYYGYRQIMYYLPGYRVYQVDVRVASSGEVRKTFWGVGGQTYVTDAIKLPPNYDTFLSPLIAGDRALAAGQAGVQISKLRMCDIYLASGPISSVRSLYPQLEGGSPVRNRNDDEGMFVGKRRNWDGKL